MSFERRTPVVLVCCGSLNPVTVGHLKMFEIARNFMERMGTHIVIGGIFSPVHDGYKKPGLLPAQHRIEMCKLAVQRHHWLSVDSWESEQKEWVETIKVLQHHANKIKETYGVECLSRRNGSLSPYSPTQTAVTLQPGANGLSHTSFPIRSSAGGQGSMPNSHSFYQFGRQPSNFDLVNELINKNESLELNEASEPSLHDKTGIVLDKLGKNLRRMCCARPTAFDIQGNMVYGASCDLRRTKIMLLCGGDLLESFATPGLWKEEHIREIVSEYGIVCIPRYQSNSHDVTVSCGANLMNRSPEDKGEKLRKALDRLHNITRNVSGTIILVNDIRTPEIAHISSTKCRQAIMRGSPDANRLVVPSVMNYIKQNDLYMEKVAG